jgi:hypothetical protein
MKVEVTDLKAPNDANTTVADATGVQAKLWVSSDSNDPVDTGAPHVLVTNATITGGTMSIPLDTGGTPAVDDTNKAVTGSNANSTSGTTTTLSGFVHPGGLLVVFFAFDIGTETTARTVTATFDSVSMTKISTAHVLGSQVDAFALEASAKTADIVTTINTSQIQRAIFAVPCGENVKIGDFGTSSVGVDNAVALSSSVTVDTLAGDLVLQGVRWRNSATFVSSYSTDQIQTLSDDSPTRSDVSEKAGLATSTTVTTTLNAASTGNTMASVALVITPDGINTSIGNPVLGVAKWEDSNETYFFPIDTTVQEDV